MESSNAPDTPKSSDGEATMATSTTPKTEVGVKPKVPRTDADVSNLSVLYDGTALATHYQSRSSKASLMWVKEVTTGLEDKFSAIRAETVEEQQLEAVYDLSMRVCELERLTKQRGIEEVFYTYTNGVKGGSLFANYSSVTIDQVRSSVRHVKEYEDEHLVWGMTLTFALLENSCEPELRAKINEELMGIPLMEQGGPTYFVLAIRAISSMSYSVSLSLTVKVNDMKLKDFEGEDVTKAVSFLRGALQRLKMCDQTPPNTVYLLLKIMQTSSNYRFNGFFATWYNNLEQQSVINGIAIDKLVTTDQILSMASRQYLTLNEEGQWIIQRRRSSAFNAGNLPRNGSNDHGTPHWKKAPGPNEPTERMFRGKPEHWCSKCSKWCRHSTDRHVDNWQPPSGNHKANSVSTAAENTNENKNEPKVRFDDEKKTDASSANKGLAAILRRTNI